MDHDESVLMADLASINSRIGRYVLSALDRVANRPHATEVDGIALGHDLVLLGKAVRQHERLRTASWGHSYLEPRRGHVRAADEGVNVIDGAAVGPAVCGAWLVADLPDPSADFVACTMCLAALAQQP